MKTSARCLLIVMCLTAVAAACDGDDDSAATTTAASASAQAVCTARQELRDSVEAVFEDVADLDIDAARDGLADVRAAVDDVAEARGDLTAEQRERIDPLVEEVRSGLESLGSADSIEEFGAGLDEAGSAIDEIDEELGAICD
jgi:uncharacterized phage infection (PIP) family protein YhgE